MVIRGYAKLNIRHDAVIRSVIKSSSRLAVDFDSYPLKHLTAKYVKPAGKEQAAADGSQEALKQRSESSGLESSISSPPKPICLVWILECFAQWNIHRTEVSNEIQHINLKHLGMLFGRF